MTDKNHTENSKIKNEFSKAFDEIDEILSRKKRKNGLSISAKLAFRET